MKKDSKKAAKKTTSKPVEHAARKAPQPPKDRKPRTDTKGAKILAMIQREGGASVAELAKATSWQNHSVRGFVSNLGRKQGLKIETIKRESGEHAYVLAATK